MPGVNPILGALIVANLAFILGITWLRDMTTSPQPSFAPTTILSNQTANEDSAATDSICQAHRAAIRLSPGAPSLTPMIHELLGVNVSEWPFVPVQALVARPGGRQAKAADFSVIDAYDARTKEAGIWVSVGSEVNVHGRTGKAEDVVVAGKALSLASEVLLVRASRNLYLSKMVPLVENAAAKVTRGRGETEEEFAQRQQEARVNALIHWCGEHSRVRL